MQNKGRVATAVNSVCSLKNISIVGGTSTSNTDPSASVWLNGTVSVSNCVLRNKGFRNVQTSGVVTITGSTINGGDNYAYTGIYVYAGTCSLSSCIVSDYINGPTVSKTYISNSSFDALQLQSTVSSVELSGTITIIQQLRGNNGTFTAGSILTLKSGCVLDYSKCTSSIWSGIGTLIVESNVSIKPYGGGANIPITAGTYSKYRWNRVGTFEPQP